MIEKHSMEVIYSIETLIDMGMATDAQIAAYEADQAAFWARYPKPSRWTVFRRRLIQRIWDERMRLARRLYPDARWENDD